MKNVLFHFNAVQTYEKLMSSEILLCTVPYYLAPSRQLDPIMIRIFFPKIILKIQNSKSLKIV